MNRYLIGTVAAVSMVASAEAGTVDFTAMNLNGTAAVSGGSLVLTQPVQSQTGSAFIATPFDIGPATTFSARFSFSITHPWGGADGFAFVVQNAPSGADALGPGGGYLGYFGVASSIAVEFDNFQNGWDPNPNHVGVNIGGNIASTVLADPGFSLDNVVNAQAWVDYDGTTLDVFVAQTGPKPTTALLSTVLDLDGLLGPQAYFGFSGATGGLTAKHAITDFDLTVAAPQPVPLPAGAPLLAIGLGALVALRRGRRAALRD